MFFVLILFVSYANFFLGLRRLIFAKKKKNVATVFSLQTFLTCFVSNCRHLSIPFSPFCYVVVPPVVVIVESILILWCKDENVLWLSVLVERSWVHTLFQEVILVTQI